MEGKLSFCELFAGGLVSCIVSAALPLQLAKGECLAECKLLLQALIFYFSFIIFGVIPGGD